MVLIDRSIQENLGNKRQSQTVAAASRFHQDSALLDPAERDRGQAA